MSNQVRNLAASIERRAISLGGIISEASTVNALPIVQVLAGSMRLLKTEPA